VLHRAVPARGVLDLLPLAGDDPAPGIVDVLAELVGEETVDPLLEARAKRRVGAPYIGLVPGRDLELEYEARGQRTYPWTKNRTS
jgi:hypothetical protein